MEDFPKTNQIPTIKIINILSSRLRKVSAAMQPIRMSLPVDNFVVELNDSEINFARRIKKKMLNPVSRPDKDVSARTRGVKAHMTAAKIPALFDNSFEIHL